jgi:uroporphyrinogen decarboxylase
MRAWFDSALDASGPVKITPRSVNLSTEAYFQRGTMARKIMQVLQGETVAPPPLWLMRQAGRYLPEYRKTRATVSKFLDLCYTPDHAVEVTLQPIRRYGFDAAILFSDILVIPDALKRNVRFTDGVGPEMDTIDETTVGNLREDGVTDFLRPVIEAVRRLRNELPNETSLLGFCGAPWTVATYMVAGRGTPDQAPARLFAYKYPHAFERLLNLLADISATYLVAQIDAGADAVQIFDSWAGSLGDAEFETFAVRPVARMITAVKTERPHARVIVYAKGLDWAVPLALAAELQKDGPIQGNLDPMRLVAGGQSLKTGVARILDALGNGPLIFNLGHGITPDTDPDHVHELVKQVRQ